MNRAPPRAAWIVVGVVTVVAASAVVASKGQTLVFDAPAGMVVGDAPFDLLASSTAGLPVELALEAGPCQLDGRQVRIMGPGECSFRARQSGDSWHGAAADVVRIMRIDKADDTVQLVAPASRTYGDAPFAVRGSTTHGLPVAFDLTGPCTVAGATVTITGAGDCTVQARSEGDARTKAASVTQVVTIARAAQSIVIPELGPRTYGEGPFTMAATSTSGLPVAFTATGPCSVQGNAVSVRGAGTCSITATQAGDTNWAAAAPAARSVAVAKAEQKVTLTFPSVLRYGESAATVQATSSSRLPLGTSVSGACTIARDAVSPKGLIGTDTCTVTVSQSGDANVNAAPPVVLRATVIGLSWTCCRVIVAPPADFCRYFACIANFGNSAGYVMQCRDGLFSTAGGRSGSCSGHGGNARALYAP